MANERYTRYRECRADPKMVAEIQASPQMLAEQGGSAGFMSSWGGAANYRALAASSPECRVAYAAITDGVNTEAEIVNQTGLTPTEVRAAVAALKAKGLIQESDVIAAVE